VTELRSRLVFPSLPRCAEYSVIAVPAVWPTVSATGVSTPWTDRLRLADSPSASAVSDLSILFPLPAEGDCSVLLHLGPGVEAVRMQPACDRCPPRSALDVITHRRTDATVQCSAYFEATDGKSFSHAEPARYRPTLAST